LIDWHQHFGGTFCLYLQGRNIHAFLLNYATLDLGRSVLNVNGFILCDGNSGVSSRSGTPTKDGLEGRKRKLSATPEPGVSHTAAHSKRARLDNFTSAALSPYYNAGNPGNRYEFCSVPVICIHVKKLTLLQTSV
jgi:hypothetical protein